jgi:hypothetical protein
MNKTAWQITSSPLAKSLRASLRRLKALDVELTKSKGKKRRALWDRMRTIVARAEIKMRKA